MKTNLRFIPLFFCVAISCVATSFAMDLSNSMEIDEPVQQLHQVPTLRQLSVAAVSPQLLDVFKNVDTAPRLIQLGDDIRQDLWHCHMFGSDQNNLTRNPAILWLLSQCPVTHYRDRYRGDEFAPELREYNNMRVIIELGAPLQVIHTQTKEVLFQLDYEGLIVYTHFSSDGSFLYLVAADKSLRVIDTATWEVANEAKLNLRSRTPKFVNFIADNNAVVCGSLGTLSLHDTLTGASLCHFIRDSHIWIDNVKISADGNTVFVFFEDTLNLPDEYIVAALDAPHFLDMAVHRFNISSHNELFRQLPRLTLEQLLTLQIVHEVAHNREKIDCLTLPHIRAHYDALPAHIHGIIEEKLPGVEKCMRLIGYGQEPEQKKRKVDFNPEDW